MANGPIGAILLFIVFIINWFVWLGGWINQIGLMAVEENGLIGIEAFFYNNLNFMVLIGVILGTMGFMYFAK